MKKYRKKAVIIVMVIIGLPVLAAVAFVVMGQMSRSGSAPGLEGGRLTACPNRPNCVSSENPQDKGHFIAPLKMPADGPEAARATLRSVIEAMGGRISIDQNSYLAATFSSRLFGFVDDLELRLDAENGAIHLRSGSRVGYSDQGVNRKRAELLAEMYDKRAAGAE